MDKGTDKWGRALSTARAVLSGAAEPGRPPRVLDAEANHVIGELTRLFASEEVLDDRYIEALSLLGRLHWARHLALPVDRDAKEASAALDAYLAVLLAAPDPVPPIPVELLPPLSQYANQQIPAMQERPSQNSDPGLPDRIVRLWQRIVAACPDDDPARGTYLTQLGLTLWIRFGSRGTPSDLAEAIDAARRGAETTPACHPYHGMAVVLLASILRERSDRSGTGPDLDAAIDAARQAVAATAPDDPDHVGILAQLPRLLHSRYERSGAPSDLDEAIEFADRAVQAVPAGRVEHAGYRSNLGALLNSRYERTGDLADLDRAIAAGRGAVDAVGAGHPARAGFLSNLAVSLQLRFVRAGSTADLDEAIAASRQAVEALPDGHPDRAAVLSTLGTALLSRFGRTAVPTDLEAAIAAMRQAVEAVPADHPLRARYLSNLGLVSVAGYGHSGRLTDLDAAIEVSREAVDAYAIGHPDRATALSNLNVALRGRFELTADAADLYAAIDAAREAVAATATDHPGRAQYLVNLGTVLRLRFERSGSAEDRREAEARFTSAAGIRDAPPSLRIRASRAAVTLNGGRDPHGGAALLESAIELLPTVAARHLQRDDQQYALGDLVGLASDAAALVLADESAPEPERAARALRLLEAGRAVLLSQALDTRSDLTDLRRKHPELALRYTELCDLLDQAPAAVSVGHSAGQGPSQGRGPDRRVLAAEFAAALAQIRALPGFASFALLPDVAQLAAHATAGPVVTFNVSVYRSDALLLTPEGVTAVPLPGLDQSTLRTQITAFHQALAADVSYVPTPSAPRDLAPDSRNERPRGATQDVLAWLWEVAAEPVLAALGYHGPPIEGETWPRVWWATGGLLGQLPVHAAGRHDPGEPGQAVVDRVVSSYTPTIRALEHAREQAAAARAAQAAQPLRSLIVAMPTTPDLPPAAFLPGAAREADLLAARLPGAIVLCEPDTSTPGTSEFGMGVPDIATELPVNGAKTIHLPTRAAVLEQLQQCAIAHFACHGSVDSADPSHSRLLLHDHATAPLTVASLASVRLQRAQLAYLSACRTATQGSQLLDESIQLATAFQLAGFPHVIATLWQISDPLAPIVADTLYAALGATRDQPGRRGEDGCSRSETALDTTRSAYALHQTIRTLRAQHPELPSLWAAYLHAGA